MPENNERNSKRTRHSLSRRDFLKMLGSAGVAIPIVVACSPAPAAQPTAAPAQPTAAAAPKPTGAAAPAAAPSAAAATGGGEIAIGAVVPLTGGGSLYGPNMLKAFDLTIQDINKAGGPLGRQLKLYSVDDQTKPDAGVAGAQKLMDLNNAICILGTWSSAVTLAIIPITVQKGIIEMNTSGAPQITAPSNNGLVFRTQAVDKSYGLVMARYCKQNNINKIGMFAANNPFALAMRDSFYDELKVLGMQPVTTEVVVNPGASSYAGELGKVMGTNPDAIIMAAYAPEASVALKEWYATGKQMKFLGPGFGFNDDLIKNIGVDAAEGLIAVDAVPAIGKPGYKAFADTFKAATNADLADNYWAAQCHDQINLVALAVEKAKSTKGADLVQAIRDVSRPPGDEVYDFASGVQLIRQGKDINYQGASGNVDFNDEGNIAADMAVWVIEKGKLKQVDSYPAEKLS